MTDPRDLARDIGRQVTESVGKAISQTQRHRPLPYDLLETDDAVLAVVDAPGATASDVAVRVTDHRIEVQVDRFREFDDEFEMVFPGRALALDGVIELPPGAEVDTDEASARLTDRGTLEIEIPTVRRGTDVPIQSGSMTDEATEADASDRDETDTAGDTRDADESHSIK